MELLHFTQVKSTMDEARKAAEGGQTPPFLVLADRQTEGRGRLEGRCWESKSGASLAMTLCLEPSASRTPALSLRAGLGVATSLQHTERLTGRIALKWPNDILGLAQSGGEWKKLGGILCESSALGLFIGIGVNLKPDAYGPALAVKATSLEELMPDPQSVVFLPELTNLEKVASEIAWGVVASIEDQQWLKKYSSILWGIGQELRFTAGDPRSSAEGWGRLLGVEEDGSIVLLEQGNIRKRYHSGEISGLAQI
jgi:BirA family biotin operon repressor/biotin-[acetyl-CoA-carboxylase] ligase